MACAMLCVNESRLSTKRTAPLVFIEPSSIRIEPSFVATGAGSTSREWISNSPVGRLSRCSTCQPHAFRRAAAFHFASSTSLSGEDPMVMPPPAAIAPNHRVRSFVAINVRMRMFHAHAPEWRSIQPMEPVQYERGRCSSSSIVAQTTVRGHPVMLPPGNTAWSASREVCPSDSVPTTCETRC